MEAKKGTTTVGVMGKDFVVLAADKMASVGDLAADLNTRKVFKISDHIAMTTAGMVGDLQLLTRFLKAKINRMTIEEGEEPSPRRVAVYLGTLLNAS
ncbi:TPA: proteasome subunit beta, partial [Candidatus Micrarchaeota archaeon]|nr:proteasome subunit beta [Candidatus Micrarchaeota archaeon]